MLLFLPFLLFAHDKEDPAKNAARKAALNEFFGKSLCLECHGSTPTYNIKWARAGYDRSLHKNGGHSFYSNGDECQKCHTHEGFVKYGGKDLKIDPKSFIKHPSQQSCFTCHAPHERGDMSLRITSPVNLDNGKKFDIGKGNLCANCHHSRGKATETAKAMPAEELKGYWGAHHGPQADMLIGNNAYEYSGKTYYSSVHSTLTKDSCIECHMSYPQNRFAMTPAMGGHSFEIVGEVHHQPALNTAGCLGSCHAKINQKIIENPDTPVDTFWWHQTKAVFDYEAKADFDNDGKVEVLQAEIEGLLNLFVNKKGTGYLQRGELPMYKKDGGWNWTKSKKERPLKEVAALYNYKFVLEDRSRGIHNAPYTIQILYDTLETLDPGFDTSKRNVYRPPEEYKPPEPKKAAEKKQ
jgi:hypothetical protein